MSAAGRHPFGARTRTLAILFAVVLAADQATKIAAARWLDAYEPVSVIPGFLQLALVHNTGMAFGLLNDLAFAGKAWILTGVSAALLALIAWFAVRAGPLSPLTGIGLTAMLSGALGNIVDRLARGHVVDFLDAYVGSAHWPTFNLADSAICVGAGLLLCDTVREARRASRRPNPEPEPEPEAAEG